MGGVTGLVTPGSTLSTGCYVMNDKILVSAADFFFAAVTLPTATGGGKIPRSQKGKVFP